MADKLSQTPLKSVRIDALVVLKICKHASSSHPQVVTGQLLGMDVDSELQITNSFPFPSDSAPSNTEGETAGGAASAPRAKANTYYQTEMMRCLREQNIDANSVGWYQSANLGNFLNSTFIENQFFFQSQPSERSIALIHDTTRSTTTSLSLHAYRLTPAFMAAHREGKYTLASLAQHNLTYRDILTELPLTIQNSHLLTTFLHQLDTPAPTPLPLSLSAPAPLAPNFDSLDLSVDPFLEKHCDLLLDSIEAHYSEVNNQQYYSRQLAREQAKIAQWQQKRKAENQVRAASKQAPLPEDEWQRLFKLPQEPSRLETLLVSRQIEQYARQVDGFVAGVSAKMFAVQGGLVRTD